LMIVSKRYKYISKTVVSQVIWYQDIAGCTLAVFSTLHFRRNLQMGPLRNNVSPLFVLFISYEENEVL
jgi:hypothetical protein